MEWVRQEKEDTQSRFMSKQVPLWVPGANEKYTALSFPTKGKGLKYLFLEAPPRTIPTNHWFRAIARNC